MSNMVQPEINKFSYSKIYKLINETTDKIYIGSTTERLLCSRLAKHKNNYKRWLNNNCNKTTASELLKLDGVTKIELIEFYPCTTSTELLNRERHYINLYSSLVVNKNIPGRTSKEYYEANKERILESKKQKRILNKISK